MNNKPDTAAQQEFFEYLHKFCISNQELLKSSNLCGCFYCKKIYEKDLIKDWINDKKGKTARCPYCGVDSILPDSEVKLSLELLEEMNRKWF